MCVRREGDNKITCEVDDLITLLLFLDENKLLSALPKYVSSSPDSMPSARLLEEDLNVLLVMLEKMGNNFEEYRSALAAIVNDVGELRSKVAATVMGLLQLRFEHDRARFEHDTTSYEELCAFEQ